MAATGRHGSAVYKMASSVFGLCERGGKRLRPALVAVGFRGLSPRGSLGRVLRVGVSLELLQAYFLIHDDLMDDDDVRRGGPSVHVDLSQRFASKQVGAASAILAGDYAAALALRELLAASAVRGQGSQLLARFSEIQLDAIAGQQRDIAATRSRVEDTYALKTASYTVAGPLCMGAILARATPSYLKALDRFALPAGIAFQLRDDLIGAFGKAQKTGKPRGHDIREGKITPLYLEAFRRSKGAQQRQLTRVFANARATETELDKALAVIVETGAREHVEERISELCSSASASLRSSAFNTRSRGLLSGALSALTARSR